MTRAATLPRRVPGEHLPIGAPTRYVGRAKVPGGDSGRFDDAPDLSIPDLVRLRDSIRTL
jgi:hypothetical protein